MPLIAVSTVLFMTLYIKHVYASSTIYKMSKIEESTANMLSRKSYDEESIFLFSLHL